MGKNPAFQFYPNDWLRDTNTLSPEAKGGWVDLLSKIHYGNPRGQITDSVLGYSRLFGCTKTKAEKIINELIEKKICDYTSNGNDTITIISRRMSEEEWLKDSARRRKAKQRETGGGDPKRWTAIRAKILERDENTCQYCGEPANTVDHIFPRSRGGTEAHSNLVAACKGCNFRKTNKTPEEAGMKINSKSHRRQVLDSIRIKSNEAKSHEKVTAPSSKDSSSSSSTTTKPIKNICADFEIFWSAYPRKQDKKKAYKSWGKIKPDATLLQKMLANIKLAKETKQWQEKIIPLPATWLNNDRWEDEYIPAKKTAADYYEDAGVENFKRIQAQNGKQ